MLDLNKRNVSRTYTHWYIISNACEKWQKKARIKNDRKCRPILADCCLEPIQDKQKPLEIRKSLQFTFARKSTISQISLKKQQLTLKFNGYQDLDRHFLKFDRLVRDLKECDTKMAEASSLFDTTKMLWQCGYSFKSCQ